MLQPSLESFEAQVSALGGQPAGWTKPTEFDFSSAVDRAEASRRMEEGTITATHDTIREIGDDLFEVRYPDRKHDDTAREEFARALGSRGLAYGRWFHFEWDGSLVRYPEVDDLRALKTFRNKNIITDDEQDALYDSTVAVMGLSVGSSVVDQLTMSGIGGTQVLADFDTLSPTNLNRIRADFSQVGMRKIDIMAQKVSKSDPYINQVHFRDGITEQAFGELAELRPDVIYDEIDDLAMKAMIRVFAAENKIPVVMATDVGDKSLIDIERHDLKPTKPFNGRLSDTQVEGLIAGDMSEKQKRQAIVKLVGVKNVSPRAFQSLMEIDKTLGGLPQLGTTATLGGSLAAVAGREIIVGRSLDSGRYGGSMKELLDLQSQTGLRETAAIFHNFLANSRKA